MESTNLSVIAGHVGRLISSLRRWTPVVFAAALAACNNGGGGGPGY